MLLAIPLLSLLFLQNSQVQTLVSRAMADRLSEELDTRITVGSVNYSFFNRIQVRELTIEDRSGDTLLFSEITRLRIKQIQPERRRIEIRRISLENALVNLVIDSTGTVNLRFITDRLRKPHVPPELKNRLQIGSVELIDSRFLLSDRRREGDPQRFDLADLRLMDLQIRVHDLTASMDTVRMEIENLSCMEPSGLVIGQLTGHLSIGKTHLVLDGLSAKTSASDLSIPALGFHFEAYTDFSDFAHRVNLDLVTETSRIDLDDLACFFPRAGQQPLEQLTIDGHLHGPVSDLKGDELFVTFDDRSSLAFDFVMIGLPDFRNTFLDFNFRQLNTSAAALGGLLYSGNQATAPDPEPWVNFGNMVYRGSFTGYPDHFVASGLLSSDLGRMVLDLSFRPDTINGLAFNGRLRTAGFRLGTFLDREKYLSTLDMDIATRGTLNRGRLRATLEGSIDTLEFYDYAYSNIIIDGLFTNTTFDGGFSINDPNIRMDFQGRMDFSGEVPLYNFTADVARARPHFLNLEKNDPNSFASFLIETNLSGSSLDELNGEVRLVNSLFERTGGQLQLYDMNLRIRNNPSASLIRIRTDLFDADLAGKYRLSALPGLFRRLADHYVDVSPGQEIPPDSASYFSASVNFTKINPVLDFFYPDLQIGDGSSLDAVYDPAGGEVLLEGTFPQLGYSRIALHRVRLLSRARGENFLTTVRSDSMVLGGGYALHNQEIILDASGDTANLSMQWDNREIPGYSGRLNLTGNYVPVAAGERGFRIDVRPATFFIDEEQWNLNRSSVLLKPGYFRFDSVALVSSERYIMADGTITTEEDKDFSIEIRNLNMSGLMNLTGINADLGGNLTGSMRYYQADSYPQITTDLSVDTMHFNGMLLGPAILDAAWNESQGGIRIRMNSQMHGKDLVHIEGDYRPGNGMLDFDLSLSDIELKVLDRYLSGFARDLEGRCDLVLTLNGTIREPELNGSVIFHGGAATLSYLNTRYRFNDRVRVYHNNFYLQDFMITDPMGNGGRINGTVSSTYLKDLYTSLNISVRNLLCLNTTPGDNEVFYGTLFASGNALVSGRPGNLKLMIEASTERNSAIYLPLYQASEVRRSDFISFISEKENGEELPGGPVRRTGGLEMEMEVEVTSDAMVQLIFDPQVGDIIETRGSGSLRMELDPEDGFSMFGEVTLQEGEYLFTLQNVINKRFQIEPGGNIIFSGSPAEATIGLNAIYTTRVAPYNLYLGDNSEVSEKLKKRIPVECHLQIQGQLGSPAISTDIEMPTADPQTRILLENSISTDEELMKQFLSLLVINNFYSVSGYRAQDVGTMNSSLAGVTASELLSNQLSNWLSQISDDFDIGVNYRPGDQISSDEVEVALSTQLLDDRIIISGNVDVGGQETSPTSGAPGNPYIVGDFDVEFRVTDNVSITAFNRARDELLFETAPYKQGVGVSYREEFNSLRELFNRFKEGLIDRKKKKKRSGESEQHH